MGKDASKEAQKAIAKLSGKANLRKAIGEARDGLRDVRSGPGQLRDLDNRVHY